MSDQLIKIQEECQGYCNKIEERQKEFQNAAKKVEEIQKFKKQIEKNMEDVIAMYENNMKEL